MTTQTERHVVYSDGARTLLETWGDDGPIVLCVHGIASSRRSWARLGRRLAHRFRVFAYDQRGHGDSAHVEGPMTLARGVSDLHEVARALPGPIDLLIGHSWGGAVAVLGGRALPAGKVVAIDPMLRVEPGTFESEYVEDLREPLALEAVAKESALREMYAGAHELDLAGKLHAMLPMSVGALERLGRDNRVDEGGWDVRDAVAGYPVPLLLLAAGVDSVLSAADLAFVRERGGPNVDVRVFPNEGHNLHRTAFDEFVHAVAAFA